MKTIPDGKYRLRDLHQEIGLMDRKIGHAQNFESFETEEERTEALSKLQSKREELVKAAEGMVGRGVEYDLKEVPGSMKASLAVKESQ
jgi:hypothetical protein